MINELMNNRKEEDNNYSKIMRKQQIAAVVNCEKNAGTEKIEDTLKVEICLVTSCGLEILSRMASGTSKYNIVKKSNNEISKENCVAQPITSDLFQSKYFLLQFIVFKILLVEVEGTSRK